MPTYDTTSEDESTHGRQTLDGTEDTVASLTVPSGELWDVDGAYVTTDGSGDASGVELAVTVADSTTLDGMAPTIDRAGRSASVGVDTTMADGGVAEVDAYASAGEEVRLVESYEQGSTGGTTTPCRFGGSSRAAPTGRLPIPFRPPGADGEARYDLYEYMIIYSYIDASIRSVATRRPPAPLRA